VWVEVDGREGRRGRTWESCRNTHESSGLGECGQPFNRRVGERAAKGFLWTCLTGLTCRLTGRFGIRRQERKEIRDGKRHAGTKESLPNGCDGDVFSKGTRPSSGIRENGDIKRSAEGDYAQDIITQRMMNAYQHGHQPEKGHTLCKETPRKEKERWGETSLEKKDSSRAL